MESLRADACQIIDEAIRAVMPGAAVKKALQTQLFSGRIVVVAIGKAAWEMAYAANEVLGDRVSAGIVITKYMHAKGPIGSFEIVEAGHPAPDENSVLGAAKALEMVSMLTSNDQVLLLLSGGGSALFEMPMPGVTLEELIDVSDRLLRCGADIIEINTVRKHLSAVKGGRFAGRCGGAEIYTVVLSDVLGDRLDTIASGPAYPDSSTSGDALGVIEKYQLAVSDSLKEVLSIETPKDVPNCETVIAGSVRDLCAAAGQTARQLGYSPLLLTTALDCEAREAGRFMAAIARGISHGSSSLTPPCAVIAGGETVVRVTGSGTGGRNQELALAAALGIEGLDRMVLFSLGSDGTDGPTDAAGGLVDGTTVARMRASARQPLMDLNNNNSYHALLASGDLIITGPTGTNVNDLVVLLCR